MSLNDSNGWRILKCTSPVGSLHLPTMVAMLVSVGTKGFHGEFNEAKSACNRLFMRYARAIDSSAFIQTHLVRWQSQLGHSVWEIKPNSASRSRSLASAGYSAVDKGHEMLFTEQTFSCVVFHVKSHFCWLEGGGRNAPCGKRSFIILMNSSSMKHVSMSPGDKRRQLKIFKNLSSTFAAFETSAA